MKQWIQKAAAADQAILKVDEESLMYGETEFVDDSVDCRLSGRFSFLYNIASLKLV